MDLLDKIKNDTETGIDTEERFIKLMEKKGYLCYRANNFENIHEHWDVCTVKEFNGVKIFERIDVKGIKSGYSDGYTWIELKNVHGNPGWVYSDVLNTIVFEMEDSYYFVDRNKLLTFVEKKMLEADVEDGSHIIYDDNNNLKYYREYSRIKWGRNDGVIKMPLADIEQLVVRKLNKE